MIELPLRAVAVIVETAASRRGVALAFLVLAAFLATRGWIRPPLSPDIRSLYLPVGMFAAEREVYGADEILHGPRRVPPDSVGAILVVMFAGASGLLVVYPRALSVVAGVLLCASLAANSSVIFNHPGLIELLEGEREQRDQMASLLAGSVTEPLVLSGGSRVDPALKRGEAALFPGRHYSLYGAWLVPLAGVAAFLAGSGSLRRRLAAILAWGGCGLALSGLVCFRSLGAEYYLLEAERLEHVGDFIAARGYLDRATSLLPELGRLKRAWLLEGKLDFHAGRPTQRERFFRIEQLLSARDWRRALALLETPPEADSADPPARRQRASILTLAGREHYRAGRLAAAQDAWRRAVVAEPSRLDCPFYIGMAQARLDLTHPELVEAEFAPVIARIADRVLRADILSSLGDAYFAAGRMAEARRHYEQSLRVFELPKDINYRARKGLIGF